MKTFAKIILAGSMFAAANGTARGADEIVGVQPEHPWYAEILIGGPLPHDFDFTFDPAGPAGVYDPVEGFMVAGAVGKYITESVRADINVSVAWAHDGAVTLPGAFVVPHTGSVNAVSILGNAYYEFGGVSPIVTPWIGAGAGATIFTYNSLGGPGFQYNDSATAFTVAGHLGADVAITDNLDFTARYSLTWTDNHSVSSTTVGAVPMTVSSQVNNIFTVGLRYKFGGTSNSQ